MFIKIECSSVAFAEWGRRAAVKLQPSVSAVIRLGSALILDVMTDKGSCVGRILSASNGERVAPSSDDINELKKFWSHKY
ncbi:hypothetical protein GZ77_26150 [Endozoicomonas montiporae]|uniref:Uncharacterized protein n=1 Tax=Endozoicomonas montiporae TaxID=1027273 RepID=A0A081MYI1_9GAMM|nr:hypothetical protein [Endozoicomonas montiporae]KEQ11254.1 hypothetical protein GZ77_26525 [Endozoicomonas montiporae]KEQ11294.1 hypothetical protein GZ77_26150 [Endozoicomonas montiporae]